MDKETQKKMIRAGLFTKGIIYFLIGLFPLLSVFGQSSGGGETSGKKGIIGWIMQQSYGPYLVAAVAIGLIFYSLWQMSRCIYEGSTDDKKDLLKKVGFFVSGMAYFGFAIYAGLEAYKGLSGSGSSGSGSQGGGKKQQVIAQLMDSTWGQVLIIAVGIILIGVSFFYAYKALSGKYKEEVEGYSIDSEYKKYLIYSGYLGYLGRGLTFILIAYMLIMSVVRHDSQEMGSGEAMALMEGTGGQVALAVISFGLLCYGVFMMLQAKYRDVDAVV